MVVLVLSVLYAVIPLGKQLHVYLRCIVCIYWTCILVANHCIVYSISCIPVVYSGKQVFSWSQQKCNRPSWSYEYRVIDS